MEKMPTMKASYPGSIIRASLSLLTITWCVIIQAQPNSFEQVVPASSFSIEPAIRSSQIAQGDGSALLATNALTGALGDADLLLRKMNASGDLLHEVNIGDAGGQGYHDVGMEVVQLGEHYFICGYTRGIDTTSPPTFTSFLIKLDTALNFQWQKNYVLPGPLELYANSMTLTDNGQFLIAGQLYDGFDFHTMLMKVGSDGSVIWMKQYQIPNGERVHCVRELPGGDILLSGNMIFGFELVLPFAFKVDPNGDFIWGRFYNYPPASPVEHSNFLFIHVQSVDDILLCGHTDVMGVGGQDYYIVDIDSSGAVNWARTYGAPQTEFPTAALFDAAASEVIMLGSSSSFTPTFTPNALAMRIAPGGLLIDAKLFGDTTTTQQAALMATQRVAADSRMMMGWRGFPDDDIYMAGTDNDLSNTCNSFAVLPASLPQTSTTGPFTAVVTTTAVLVTELTFITSSFLGDSLLCDSPTAVPEPMAPTVDILTVVPNPAVGDIRLVCRGELRRTDAIEIVDVNGRILRTIHGNGTREVLIERGDLSPGMYLVRILRNGAPWGSACVVAE